MLRLPILLLAAHLTVSCGGPDLPLPGYEPDPSVQAVGTSAARVEEVPGHPGLSAPVDRMVVLLHEGQGRASAEALASELGGSVVGALELIRFFQLQLPTRTMAELDAALASASADPRVASAGHDFIVQWRSCPAESDVKELDHPASCPWETSEYQAALTAVEEMDVNFSPIRVGLIDTGIERSNGEFDETTLANVMVAGGDPSGLTDAHGHGTQVAGVIAADDRDGGVNGIASRFLGHRLTLIWGFNDPDDNLNDLQTAAQILRSALFAVDAGAKVVNLSLGFGPFGASPTAEEVTIRQAFAELFARSPDVLFVVAAGNKPYPLTGTNDAPAGIQAPNVITVGSSSPCDPTARDPLSSYGPRVEIVAQGESITLVGHANGRATVVDSGTSFATPQVTATAAILRAIDPTLTAAETRQRILAGAQPGPETTAGRTLSVAAPILQLLLDLGSPFTEELDGDADGSADRPGDVVAQLCGGSSYSVQGFGSHTYEHASTNLAQDGFLVTGNIAEAGFGMTLIRTDSDSLSAVCEGCAFDLSSFPIDREGPLVVSYSRGPLEAPTAGGVGVAGAWTFTDCTIVDRFPELLSEYDSPMTVLVHATMNGSMEVGDESSEDPVVVGFSGRFEVPLIAEPLPAEHPLIHTLESQCEGGRER